MWLGKGVINVARIFMKACNPGPFGGRNWKDMDLWLAWDSKTPSYPTCIFKKEEEGEPGEVVQWIKCLLWGPEWVYLCNTSIQGWGKQMESMSLVASKGNWNRATEDMVESNRRQTTWPLTSTCVHTGKCMCLNPRVCMRVSTHTKLRT